MGAIEIVGSKELSPPTVLRALLRARPTFSSLSPDSVREKKFVRAEDLVSAFECGAKKSIHLEGEDR